MANISAADSFVNDKHVCNSTDSESLFKRERIRIILYSLTTITDKKLFRKKFHKENRNSKWACSCCVFELTTISSNFFRCVKQSR
jgi:hypothetical protein